MRSTLQELKDTFFGLATLNFSNLPEESRGNLGTQLAEQAAQRKGTSPKTSAVSPRESEQEG